MTKVETQEKYRRLQEILNGLGRVIIAYSGGTDSTFLLKAAIDTLGAPKVLACIGLSPSLGRCQHGQALAAARGMGVTVRELKVHELEDPLYKANRPDRCFHCKSHLYRLLAEIASEEGFDNIACGSNLDDATDYRPGNRAAEQLGVKAPLMDAGLTKDDIRALSRRMGLATADLPASPCLASRISYGLEVTAGRLRQVEEAEDFLRGLGFTEFRLRHHGETARIELAAGEIERAAGESMRKQIVRRLRELGFIFIALDLEGFRSGALNETLRQPASPGG